MADSTLTDALAADLELDIRELAGAKPAEMAARLVERGWRIGGVWFESREALTAALAEAMPGPAGRWGQHVSWPYMDEQERASQVAEAAAIVAAMLPPKERP